MNDIIQWIFFDIGSTLVDEEAAYRHRIRDMIQNTPVTFDQFYEKRIQYAKAGYNGDQKAIEYFGLKKTPWHSEDEVPFEDCQRTLQALYDRGYRLGIIANQEPGAKQRLDDWGLGRFFSVIASSAEMGISKPDAEIFLRALEMAGCRPENAVMVGDRLDNDICPANKLGMMTIRIRKGLAVYMKPTCGTEIPDHTVDTLSDIPGILSNCLIVHQIKAFEQINGRKLMDIYAEGNYENTDFFYPDMKDKEEAVHKVEADFLEYIKKDFFKSDGNEYWILEDNGVSISAVRLYLLQKGQYYLEALETHPGFRRKGYAAKLLNTMIGQLKGMGSFSICDCVSKKNEASVRTHLKCGFQIVSEEGKDYLTGETDSRDYGMRFEYEA